MLDSSSGKNIKLHFLVSVSYIILNCKLLNWIIIDSSEIITKQQGYHRSIHGKIPFWNFDASNLNYTINMTAPNHAYPVWDNKSLCP